MLTKISSLWAAASFAVFLCSATAHSLLSDPKPTASKTCRLGGVPSRGIETCPGPCDLSPLQGKFLNQTSPENPSAVYRRGQRVTIRYQRNNHGPGGFVRMSLVPVDKMMNKVTHEENAFHYSCWGANPVRAKPSELGRDALGFSLVGSDGKLHNLPVSYYTTEITIPPVVPDGVYALGWVWYGGMGGSIYGNAPEDPYPDGFFGDYWSCAFVSIKGGRPLERSFMPVFQGNLHEYWGDNCMSANDAPGICTYEPCIVPGKLQKPRTFKNGSRPNLLFQSNFKSAAFGSRSALKIPNPVPESQVLQQALEELYLCKSRSMKPSEDRELEP